MEKLTYILPMVCERIGHRCYILSDEQVKELVKRDDDYEVGKWIGSRYYPNLNKQPYYLGDGWWSGVVFPFLSPFQ